MLVRRTARRTSLSAVALAAALALSACGGSGGSSEGDNAPAPVEALPTPVQSLAVNTDVGQFLVQPTEGTAQADIDETVAKLKGMDGVQSVEVNDEGFVDLQFHPTVTPEQRQEALRQLAALGEVVEGI